MNIPITFSHKGKSYSGYFSPVAGSGSSSMFHLMINNFYYGQLFYTSSGWRFGGLQFRELAEFFGMYVSAFMEFE